MCPSQQITAEEFELLVQENYDAVYLVAYSRVTNREQAQDIAQESFLRAFLALDRLQDPSRFPHWVCRIARNLAIDWLRSPAHLRHVTAELDVGRTTAAVNEKQSRNPREAAIRAETALRTTKAVAELTSETREVLLLHYVVGLNFRQIADRLGVHPTTVRYRVGKAAMQCRDLLREHDAVHKAVLPEKTAIARCIASVGLIKLVPEGARRAAAAKALPVASEAAASLGTGTSKAAVLLSNPFTLAAYTGGLLMGSKHAALGVGLAVLLIGGGTFYIAEKDGANLFGRTVVEGPVTIRRSAPGTGRGMGYVKEHSQVFTSATLAEVLSFLNHSEPDRTVESADLPKERYDITAEIEATFGKASSDIICRRFGLQVRREEQDRDVLILTAPNGQPAALRPPAGPSYTKFGDESFQAGNTHIRLFYSIVEDVLKKPVINETGISLTEYFDYEFSWKGVDKNEQAMIEAVRNQLGFVLTPARRPVEILIIERKK